MQSGLLRSTTPWLTSNLPLLCLPELQHQPRLSRPVPHLVLFSVMVLVGLLLGPFWMTTPPCGKRVRSATTRTHHSVSPRSRFLRQSRPRQPDVRLEASGSVRSLSSGIVSRSPSVKFEDACQHAISSAYVTTPGTRPGMEVHPIAPKPSETCRLETPLYVLDHDHVRPGLSCVVYLIFRCRECCLIHFCSNTKTI